MKWIWIVRSWMECKYSSVLTWHATRALALKGKVLKISYVPNIEFSTPSWAIRTGVYVLIVLIAKVMKFNTTPRQSPTR